MAANWYPVIEPDLCTSCNTCTDFCPHDVFAEEMDRPVVVHPENCVEFCRGCQKACPSDAISYFGDTEKVPAGKGV